MSEKQMSQTLSDEAVAEWRKRFGPFLWKALLKEHDGFYIEPKCACRKEFEAIPAWIGAWIIQAYLEGFEDGVDKAEDIVGGCAEISDAMLGIEKLLRGEK